MKNSEEVLEKLRELGNHYQELAISDAKIGVKTKSASVAIRCYQEILKYDESHANPHAVFKAFLDQHRYRILKTELYNRYISYSKKYDFPCLTKHQFYRQIESLPGWDVVRSSDGRYFVPSVKGK